MRFAALLLLVVFCVHCLTVESQEYNYSISLEDLIKEVNSGKTTQHLFTETIPVKPATNTNKVSNGI